MAVAVALVDPVGGARILLMAIYDPLRNRRFPGGFKGALKFQRGRLNTIGKFNFSIILLE